ncbi:MAG: M48 family metallopeptidase [Succinivibrionaceae bacterium]|nr:M48 family metallopeptidase [Succinivibrionaceae bacterium]
MLVSSNEVNQQAAQAYAQVLAQARQQRALDTNPTLTRRVQSIASRLAAQVGYFRPDATQWAWEAHVINSSELNAWCMAGGKIAVYSGIVEQLGLTDDELAVVMGHEMTHALREHIREQQSQEAVRSGLLGALSALGFGAAASLADTVSNLGIMLPFSRAHENEADEIGLELMYRAGFDPDAGPRVWEKMSAVSGSQPVPILSTHPSNESRISTLRELAARLKASPRQD